MWPGKTTDPCARKTMACLLDVAEAFLHNSDAHTALRLALELATLVRLLCASITRAYTSRP